MAGTSLDTTTMNETAQVTWANHDIAHDAVKAGSFGVTILETAHDVTFDTPFADANYEVVIVPRSLVGVSTWVTNLTSTGFTINLSVGLNASFGYIAVAH